ncbi:MAG: hypothetical protein E5X35_15120 [Mesorhizobium sp.]|uniref:hypothetical protein n=1 Tax=Mesorhizobium sp. TaxID=1871066 RepID=UPI0011F6B7F9|nr:hypothetical protein [Mesorhizobium sp.]TIR32252.1 MAG: hypothetical protein E5X35_15120 [Mesorhizobium sp.]TJV33961.1 MAG: hypothetical protein E5X87_11695 [Mesorhizobium sp.]
MSEYRCTWWEYTGRSTEFVGAVSSPIMRNLETGEELSGADLPIGALWAANGDPDLYPKGDDGLAICCRLHGGHTWFIDGRASNCTMKDDTEHRCWVRHGTVGELIHVDKAGKTCAAGAGSIAVTGFHGFLHHGVLRGC